MGEEISEKMSALEFVDRNGVEDVQESVHRGEDNLLKHLKFINHSLGLRREGRVRT